MKGLKGIDDILAMTPLQQGMLFHTLYVPESSVYNLQVEFALEGDLDEGALEQAWRTVVERHTVLRTSFVWERVEKPYQVVHHHAHLKIARHDWRALSAAEQDERRRSCLEENRASLFDLTRPPLMRLALIILSEHKFRLVWTFHHIILEGWSAAIILSELWKCYGDLRAHQSPDLPPVRPYAEFIHWQQRKDQSNAEAYWRERLKGFGAANRLAIDRSIVSAPAEVKRVDSCSFTLSKNFADALKGLARTHRVTLNTVIQGAWSILLSRYSGEQDVVFGAVLSGRPPDLPGVESIVGLFVNTLPARVNVDGDVTLIPWLQALQLDQATMRQYDYSSLMQVQAWSDAPGGQPLFHTALAFQNWLGDFPSGQMTPDLQVTMLESLETSDQPLTLQAVMGDTATLNLVYDVERFDRAAVERMLTHCRILLKGMAAHPQARLKDLPLLTDPERHQLLVEWNETKTEYPANALIHELFEAQARRTPDAVAVVSGGRTMTYGELDWRTNQLAHVLRLRDLGHGQRVGLCVERGTDMLAAVLGILKAGAAYVPLDPSFPEERLRFMADDAQLALLVSTTALAGFSGLPRERQLLLDADANAITSAPDTRLPVDARTARPEDPAYVIYTSGSTGKPKGVVVPHRGVINFLTSMAREPGLTTDDVLVAVTTLSFDIAVLELQLPLTLGATVVIATRGEAIDGGALSSLLERSRATVMQATPITWRLLLEAGWTSRTPFKALVGGEAMPKELADQLIARGVELWNMYGPTETTVWSTCARITDTSNGITIGKPIANTIVRILDAQKNLCPIGVLGELCIGGDGVALGYWNRPELTTERFIPDPFSTTPGAMLYRTGDRARWRNNGMLEHLGRLDFQIKLRGFRIELGEIESTLDQHPAVCQSVVLVRSEEPGGKQLVAYVVPEPAAAAPQIQELRQYVKQRLPDFMVPAAVVLLDAFPLTPNGKIDRRALPDPGRTEQQEYNEYVEPRDQTERVLCRVWSEVLGVKRVGIDDDFFTLGGHSLLAAKVFARLDEECGHSLPLGVLFTAPTVRLLAAHYSAAGSNVSSAIVALRAVGTWPALFAVPGAFGNVVGFEELARELGSEQPFYGLQSLGLDGNATPLDSIEAMARTYASEIRSVQPYGPYALVGACFGATVAYEIARQMLADGEQVAFLGLLAPTEREGTSSDRKHYKIPAGIVWAAALSSVISRRLQLYAAEFRGLTRRQWLDYFAGKFRNVSATLSDHKRRCGVGRELNQTKVYQANLRALDRYHRQPLYGPLGSLEVFETTSGETDSLQVRIDWRRFWTGPIRFHEMPGKDSGDMVGGENARVLAGSLAQQLRLAFQASKQRDFRPYKTAQSSTNGLAGEHRRASAADTSIRSSA